jgi:hypothetical protein
MQRQPIPKIPHDIISIRPQPNDDSGTTVSEHPNRDRALGRERRRVPDQIDSGKGPDSVGDVVGAVSEAGDRGSQHL